jgi:hypothetical protein
MPIMVDLAKGFVSLYQDVSSVVAIAAQLYRPFWALTKLFMGTDLWRAFTPGTALMEKFRVLGEKLWYVMDRVYASFEKLVAAIFTGLGRVIDAVLKPFHTSLAGMANAMVDWTVKILNTFADFVVDIAEWMQVLTENWGDALAEMSLQPLLDAKKKLEKERPDWAMKGRMPDSSNKVTHEFKMEAGFQGFVEASRKIQEELLKSGAQDPAAEAAAGIMSLNETAAKQLQEQQLQTELLKDKPRVA